MTDKKTKFAKELYEINKDQYTRKFYASILQWQIYENKESFCKKWKYSWTLFFIEKRIKNGVFNKEYLEE